MTYNSHLVSIAMCTYNGEAYVSKQIQSILDQTYLNIELVIVDDGSSDNTIEIIKSLQINDHRISLYKNEDNLGFNKNFEKAIKLCSGAYIAISDQDDIWLKNKIERLVACIEDNLMVYANSAKIDENDNLLGDSIIELDRDSNRYKNYKNILIDNFVTGHNVLFKRNAIDMLLPFPKDGFYDWWMGFVMLYENKLAFCNEILTLYRIHNQSVIKVLHTNLSTSRKFSFITTVKTNLQELQNFQNYTGLKIEDKAYLAELEKGIGFKLSCVFATKLYKILWSDFSFIFPGYKKNNIKKIFFLYRYCRGLKWPSIF